jgi:hypothetical protein
MTSDFDQPRRTRARMTFGGEHKHNMVGQRLQGEINRAQSQGSGLRLDHKSKCPACGFSRSSKHHKKRARLCSAENALRAGKQ